MSRREQAAAGQRECVVCGQPLTPEGKCPRPQETLCTMTDEGPEASTAATAFRGWRARRRIRRMAPELVRLERLLVARYGRSMVARLPEEVARRDR